MDVDRVLMSRESKSVKRRDMLRYALWALMAQTAYANRQHYHMVTTWLPHFLTNTAALLLPDVLRRVFSKTHQPRNIVEETLIAAVRDNPSYASQIAPLTLGYIISHPRFNIYKGELAQLRFGGLGLDAIPHGVTAFTLSSLIMETLTTIQQRNCYTGLLADLARWGSRKPALTTFGLLALLTAFWESGEYRIYRYEMLIRGNLDAINMQWSRADTARDIATNMLCCLAALRWHQRQQAERSRIHVDGVADDEVMRRRLVKG